MTKVPGARTYDSMPEVRTDVYIAARDDVGVKVAGRSRGKRIEVKVRDWSTQCIVHVMGVGVCARVCVSVGGFCGCPCVRGCAGVRGCR